MSNLQAESFAEEFSLFLFAAFSISVTHLRAEACLLCFEVLPLSVLTYHAWKPRGAGDAGDWYDADCGWGYGNVDVGRLAGEGKPMQSASQNALKIGPSDVSLHVLYVQENGGVGLLMGATDHSNSESSTV